MGCYIILIFRGPKIIILRKKGNPIRKYFTKDLFYSSKNSLSIGKN
ncbi:Hypothetical protein Ccan_09910 [Capnocytophaga canimorsus Cc5]|uniref:Uncharacterized protein n=1 Tax=Capnocytophaga canimorsus (strain 5) TaxID=860228 RepID=F9YV64_CAPCC|nr:Hypothetical protein Ccan_09910 [Capnocytophaga canimorsus Cc5]